MFPESVLENFEAGLIRNITSFEGLPQPRFMDRFHETICRFNAKPGTTHLFIWHSTVFEVHCQEALHNSDRGPVSATLHQYLPQVESLIDSQSNFFSILSAALGWNRFTRYLALSGMLYCGIKILRQPAKYPSISCASYLSDYQKDVCRGVFETRRQDLLFTTLKSSRSLRGPEC